VTLTSILFAVLCAVVCASGATIALLLQRLRIAERQAVTDPLTGAFNRRHLDACLRAAVERRARFGEPACLMLFDVDRFKDINDRLGHASGDAVLKTIVTLAQRRARTLDLLFRAGGEEFALLLSGTRLKDALAVAEHLRCLIARARLIDGRSVSISVGVGELRDGQSPLEWLGDADQALYEAKRSGRNRVAGGSKGERSGRDRPQSWHVMPSRGA
jgi:diguanylate cyclase